MNIRVTCYNNSFDYRHCQSCGDVLRLRIG